MKVCSIFSQILKLFSRGGSSRRSTSIDRIGAGADKGLDFAQLLERLEKQFHPGKSRPAY
jgi:hypothetical protein